MPTYVRGNAVANATRYELFENNSGTYTSLGEASEINFEVSALGLAAGDHILVVRAEADGYLDSEYSDPVTYTVAEESGATLDSIAWDSLSYRDIFIESNIMPDINNNSLLTNKTGSYGYAQCYDDRSVVILEDTTAQTNYVPKYYAYVHNTQSVYIQKETGLSGAAGDVFFGGVNVKVTDWVAGRAGVNIGSDYTLAVVGRNTDGYERLSGKISVTGAAGFFLGSTGSASLTAYINNPVVVNATIFGGAMPTESEWNALYDNYCSILSASA